MTYAVNTPDSWGIVQVGNVQSLEEARNVFSSIRRGPWYKSYGTVKGVELVQGTNAGAAQRLDWFAFR
jgi:hypothetical protein